MEWMEIFGKGGSGVARPTVTFNEEVITCQRPSGLVETVKWADLQMIMIMTTEDGPAVNDVFWVFEAGNSGCVVPSDADGMERLLIRLQQLPGFDNESVLTAMASTTNQQFVCWKQA